jgi:3-phytase
MRQKSAWASALSALVLASCGADDDGDTKPEPQGLVVSAVVETEPVIGFGDAADDPAIWVHPDDPAQSLVIGTDKTSGGGLFVYDLSGAIVQFVEIGQVNNVDLRSGFELDGQETTLVTATNRTDDTLVVYALDHHTRELRDVAVRAISTADMNYGLCMYHSAGGEFYSIVTTRRGVVEQLRLFADGSAVDAESVRSFCVPSQPEGCVADDELGLLYVGEEAAGIWKFAADPDGEAPGSETPDCETAIEGTLVDSTIDGHVTRDVEGMAIAVTGSGTGYLLVSAQGAHEYVMYEREGDNAYVKTFNIFGGGAACIDGTEETDGLDVVTTPLGDAFPGGLFVVQDGFNGDPAELQNFKYVRFDHILDEVFVEGDESCELTDYGGKSRIEEAPPGPDRTEAFCETFCAKCEACYEEGDADFAEGDCHFKTIKPEFDLADCREGCDLGVVPSETSPLQEGWENWSCTDFDENQ